MGRCSQIASSRSSFQSVIVGKTPHDYLKFRHNRGLFAYRRFLVFTAVFLSILLCCLEVIPSFSAVMMSNGRKNLGVKMASFLNVDPSRIVRRVLDFGKNFGSSESKANTNSESSVPNNKFTETRVPDNGSLKTRVPDNKSSQTIYPYNGSSKTIDPGNESSTTRVLNNESPKTRVSDNESPKTTVPNIESPKTRVPDNESPRTRVPDNKSLETSVSENISSGKISSSDLSDLGMQSSYMVNIGDDESAEKVSVNLFVVIDAGSTGTRAEIYSATSRMSLSEGASVEIDSLRLIFRTSTHGDMRSTVEKWISRRDHNCASESNSDCIKRDLDDLEMITDDQLRPLISEIAEGIQNHIYELGNSSIDPDVVVFFHSTGGMRGITSWYREGYFYCARKYINTIMRTDYDFRLFTNRVWTNHLSGMNEGIYAFLSANHILGNFRKILLDRSDVSSKLISIIEVGGASMQVVIAVPENSLLPSYVVTKEINEEFLNSFYPSVNVFATSFSKLGNEISSAILFKSFCDLPENKDSNGTCRMPCLNSNMRQNCDTLSLTSEGDQKPNRNTDRLYTLAKYCDNDNDVLKFNVLGRIQCQTLGIDPDRSIDTRSKINGCTMILGTGSFDQCLAAVKVHLLDRNVPFPNDDEAQFIGFSSPLRIFEIIKPSNDFYVTGGLVKAMDYLKEYGYIGENENLTPEVIYRASKDYCSEPVREYKGKFLIKMKNGNEVAVNQFTIDTCFKLANAYLLSQAIYKNKLKDLKIHFKDSLESKGFGWPIGTIVSSIISPHWEKYRYSLGPKYFKNEFLNAQSQY